MLYSWRYISKLYFSKLEFISTTSDIISSNVETEKKSYIKIYDLVIHLITPVSSVIVMTY